MNMLSASLCLAIAALSLSAHPANAGLQPTTTLPMTTRGVVRPTAPSRFAGHAVVPGRVLVKPTKRLNVDDDSGQRAFVLGLNRALGTRLSLTRPMALGWLMLEDRSIDGDARTEALTKTVTRAAGVAAASVDAIAHLNRLPNDALLDFMWHIDNMRLSEAWDVTVGVRAARVGVVDSGIVGHEDLQVNFDFGIDFISEADVSQDGDGRDSDPSDDSGSDTDFHGTHVAGTVAADGDNGVGVVGANWRAAIAVVRALGAEGAGFSSDIGEGAFWLGGGEVPGVTTLSAGERAGVINLSLGSSSRACDPFYADVFGSLDNAGVVVVVAAGNSAGAVESPANCGGVIAVAATGPDNALTSYTCFGDEVDIVAPGGVTDFDVTDGVLSLSVSALSPFESGAPYAFLQGTSMATPNVSGVVSLLKSLDAGITRTEVEAALRATGRSCSGCGNKVLIDAAAAVALVDSGAGVDLPSCENSCTFANDGECDDGRSGAVSAVCGAGTDCNDCDGGGVDACDSRNNGCTFADDDVCDEDNGLGACPDGTDSADCGRCDNGGGGGGGGGNAVAVATTTTT